MFPYLVNWFCDTRNATALDIPELEGKTPQAWLIVKLDDIRHLRMHDFYDPVKHTLKPARENPTRPMEDMDQIGQYLGLACNTAEVNACYV